MNLSAEKTVLRGLAIGVIATVLGAGFAVAGSGAVLATAASGPPRRPARPTPRQPPPARPVCPLPPEPPCPPPPQHPSQPRPRGIRPAVDDPTAGCQGRIDLLNGGFGQPDIPDKYAIISAKDVPGWDTTDTSGRIEIWDKSSGTTPDRGASAGRDQRCLVSTKTVQNLSRSSDTAEVGDVLQYTVTAANRGGLPGSERRL